MNAVLSDSCVFLEIRLLSGVPLTEGQATDSLQWLQLLCMLDSL